MHRRFAVRPGAPDAASRAPPLPPHEPHAGQMPGQRQRPGARWAATPARRAALGAHLLLFALAPCRAAAALRSASELDREIARQFQDAFRDELGGRTTLRVGAQDKAPFVKFQGEFAGNNRFSGISIDQMKHIAFRYNFGLEFVHIPSNQTFDAIVDGVGGVGQVVGDSGDSEQVDVAVQLFTALAKRALAAYITTSPVDSSMVFVMRKKHAPRPARPPFYLFEFFDAGVWVSLLLILFAIAGVLVFLGLGTERDFRKQHEASKFVGIKLAKSFRDALYDLSCLLVGQLLKPDVPKDWASRVVYAMFKMFALGIPLLIGALLAARFIVEPLTVGDKQSLCAKGSRVKIENLCVARGSSFEEYMRAYVKDESNNCEQNAHGAPLYVLASSSQACLAAVLNGTLHGKDRCPPDGNSSQGHDCRDVAIYSALYDSKFADYEINENGRCGELVKVGSEATTLASSWVTPLRKGPGNRSKLGEALSNAILVARDRGDFDSIVSASIDAGKCDENQLTELSVRDLGGLHLLVIGAVIAASLMYCWRICSCVKGQAQAR